MVDEFYMRLALECAWRFQGLTYPNPAVGCAIVDKNGKLLSVEAHKEQGKAHAELEAVKTALLTFQDFNFPEEPSLVHEFILKNHNNFLEGSTVYVTLEPCNHYGSTPPCSLLLSSLHVKRVVVGVRDENEVASGGIKTLQNSGIRVHVGVLQKECKELLEPFLRWSSGKGFAFFKLAMSLNGVVDGGVVSSLESRKIAHKLREKISLLAIGGNTVRVDRPLLDTRLSSGENTPDVLIYSKQKEFDKTIPLFNIPNRRVHVEDNLQRVFNSPFAMIEGGEGMLKAVYEQIEWLLLFRSAKMKIGKGVHVEGRFKRLCSFDIGEDLCEWYRKV